MARWAAARRAPRPDRAATSRRANGAAPRPRAGLLEPRVRERPAVDDTHGVEPFLELRAVEQRASGDGLHAHRLVDERANDRRGIALLEQAVALAVDPAWRRGIEHDRARERRLLPEDDAVAARRDDRGCQPQLGMVVPHAHDARRDSRRAVMDGQPGAVRNRLELAERDLEPIRARERARARRAPRRADLARARSPEG